VSGASARRPFGPSRRTTVVTLVAMGLALYALVVVFSLPFSGGLLSSMGWSALSFLGPPLFNKRIRTAIFDRLADASSGGRRRRARRAAAFERLLGAAGPAGAGGAAAAPGAAAPAPAAPDGAAARAELAGAIAGVVHALAPLVPAGCGLRAESLEVVVWNSVATVRGAIAPAPLPDAVCQVLALVAGFVRVHGMTSWPPVDLPASPAAVVTERAIFSWYEAAGRPVLALDEIPLVALPSPGGCNAPSGGQAAPRVAQQAPAEPAPPTGIPVVSGTSVGVCRLSVSPRKNGR
jgi:hypothetical protein